MNARPQHYPPNQHPRPPATMTTMPAITAAPLARLPIQQPQAQRSSAQRPPASGAGTGSGSVGGVGGKGGKTILRLSKAQALAMAHRLKRWIVVGTLIAFTSMMGLVISHPVVSAASKASSSVTSSSGNASQGVSSGSSTSSSSSSSSSSSNSSSGGSFTSSSGASSVPNTSTGVS